MWANQAWASGTVPGAPGGQDKISALQQQAQQYAAFQQQREQQWQPQALNPWAWGQQGLYGMYNVYGNPASGVLPMMSVPPPSYPATNMSSFEAPPPELPPPPPQDPPPPPPPDDEKQDKGDSSISGADNTPNKSQQGNDKNEDSKSQDRPDGRKTPGSQDTKPPLIDQLPTQERLESEPKRQRTDGQDLGFDTNQGEQSRWGSPFSGDLGRGRGNWHNRGGMGRGDNRMPWNNSPAGNTMNQSWGPGNQAPGEQGDKNNPNYGQDSGRGGFNNNRGRGGRGNHLGQPGNMSHMNAKVELELDEENDEDLKEFDRQFGNWEQQFTQWREQNKNHPDKSALSRYEEDWKRWRKELLQKREEIKKKKLEKLKEEANKETDSPSNSTDQTSGSSVPSGFNQFQRQDDNWKWDQDKGDGGFGPGQDRRDYSNNQGGPNQNQSFRGRGSFNRGGMNQELSRGGFNQGLGRGGIGLLEDQGKENSMWGGIGQLEQNQQGFDQFSQGRGFSGFRGRGGFNQPNAGRGRFGQSDDGFNQENRNHGMQDRDEQSLDGFNRDAQNQGNFGMRGFGRGGFDRGRGGFSHRGRGQGTFNNQGPTSEPNQENRDQDDRIQGDFNQDTQGRGGFNARGRGRGDGMGGRGWGNFDQGGRGQGNFGFGRGEFDQDSRGASNFDSSDRGRGDFDQSGRSQGSFGISGRGREEFDSSGRGRGNFDQIGRGRGNFDQGGRGRGAYDQDGSGEFASGSRGRGSFGRGSGFDQSGRGTPGGERSFDQGEMGPGGAFGQEDRSFDQGGGFNRGSRGGGFDQFGRGRGNFDQGGRGRGNSDFGNQDFGRGRGFGMRGNHGGQFGQGRGGRGGMVDNSFKDGPNDAYGEYHANSDQDWRTNTDRWQGNNPPWGHGSGPGGRGGYGRPGILRGRGQGRPGPGDHWDSHDDQGSNRGQNPAWWNSGSGENLLGQNIGSQLTGKDDHRQGDKGNFGGFGMNEPSTIPGLDLPDTKPTAENENVKPNIKKPPSSKAVFHDDEDEKIDVKLGAERLHIGPIGVPHSKEKFTLPEDWYDDEEDNDHKDTETKEEPTKQEEAPEPETKKEVFDPTLKGQQRPQGFGAPDRGMQQPWQGDDKRERQPFGQSFEGQQKPGPGLPDRNAPWPDDRRDRPPLRHGPGDPEQPDRPEADPREPLPHDRRGLEDDPRRDRFGRYPHHPNDRWGDYYGDRPWDDRFGGRGMDSRYRDDPYYERWDRYDDRRGPGPGPGSDPYWRDEHDPYYEERYGRGSKEPYDWPPSERDPYERDRYYQDRGGPRGSYDRNDPWYGVEPRNYYDRERRDPYDRDRRDAYDRDRRDPYSRGDRDEFSRERDWGVPSVEKRTVVDYGHSGSGSGVKLPSNEGSSFGGGGGMPKQGQENIPEHIRRDPGFRMGSDDRRDSHIGRRYENSPRPSDPDFSQGRSSSPRSSNSRQASSAPASSQASPAPEPTKEPEEVGDVVTIEDLVSVPGRFMRPPKMVIILRGPPGSGKTTLAKMIKDREVENGGNPPRILCLDDYFMVETEKMTVDPDTGRKVKTKIMEYEFEPELEESYRASLIKSFKRQVDDGFFPFIVVDCVHNKVKHFEEIVSHAKKCNFEVYIGELEVDQSICHRRNTHNHSREHIQNIIRHWEKTPITYTRVDLTPFIQDAAIEEVEMEDSMEPAPADSEKKEDAEDEGESQETFKKVYNDFIRSKWDTVETQEEKLDKLDGVRSAKKRMGGGHPKSIEDWLQLSDDYDKKVSQPGKKRVRWADVEERKKQTAARERGFVLGQTDWGRMTDPSFGNNALVQIRYIEGRENK